LQTKLLFAQQQGKKHSPARLTAKVLSAVGTSAPQPNPEPGTETSDKVSRIPLRFSDFCPRPAAGGRHQGRLVC